jgi:hypothetical protein
MTRRESKLYSVYYRNPVTRTFERLPAVQVLYARGRAREISPSKYAKWYTIPKEDE